MSSYHLTSNGLLAAHPSPSASDAIYHDQYSPVPAGERRLAAVRDDVLSYRTPALADQTPVTGPAVVTLSLTSSASHVHLDVAILAVGPGVPILLGEAVVHASGLHRRATRPVQVMVSVRPAIVPAGHQLRLDLYRGHCPRCPGPDQPAVDRIHYRGSTVAVATGQVAMSG
jgi:predicted acyl esterase